jgi:mannose-6-phosphate isomerase-like protein (cupin superfamily)
MNKVNLREKLSAVNEFWKPKIIGELNNQHVKVVKIKDSFVWHHHEKEDELFLVLKGKLKIHLKDKTVHLNEGEFFIVPKGVEHKPAADEEVHLLLFEPAGTLNTGNVKNEMTVPDPEKI